MAPALPALAFGLSGAASAAFLVSLASAFRSACFARVASLKAAMLDGLIEYDHFGTYGRAREDWLDFGRRQRKILKISSLLSVALFIALIADLE